MQAVADGAEGYRRRRRAVRYVRVPVERVTAGATHACTAGSMASLAVAMLAATTVVASSVSPMQALPCGRPKTGAVLPPPNGFARRPFEIAIAVLHLPRIDLS